MASLAKYLQIFHRFTPQALVRAVMAVKLFRAVAAFAAPADGTHLHGPLLLPERALEVGFVKARNDMRSSERPDPLPQSHTLFLPTFRNGHTAKNFLSQNRLGRCRTRWCSCRNSNDDCSFLARCAAGCDDTLAVDSSRVNHPTLFLRIKFPIAHGLVRLRCVG